MKDFLTSALGMFAKALPGHSFTGASRREDLLSLETTGSDG